MPVDKSVVVLGPTMTEEHAYHVHAHGCSDMKDGKYGGVARVIMWRPSVRDIVYDAYEDVVDDLAEEWGALAKDVRVFPCADGLVYKH